MGFNVHLNVAFSCEENDEVASLARKYAQQLPKNTDCHVIHCFLYDLGRRSGINSGTKGGLCLWGMVGNHTNVREFVHGLEPFWRELISGRILGGTSCHEHIIVFYEEEGTDRAHCHEIGNTAHSQELQDQYFERLGLAVWRLGEPTANHYFANMGAVASESQQPPPELQLEIRHHELPFAWMQY